MSPQLTLSVGYLAACMVSFLLIGPMPVGAEPYQVIDVRNGGTITGVATWKGDIPELPPTIVQADTDFCGEEVPSQALQVNSKNTGVRNVLIYLETVEKGKAPDRKYGFKMEGCQFKQHVLPFVRSQMLSMVNLDPLFHNPHFFNAKNISLLNIPMPLQNQEISHKYLEIAGKHEKGVMRLQCDVHSNMNAYWAGFDHPYFAVTNEDGTFEISGVPPGKYTLVAWHEGYKVIREETSRPFYDRPHIHRQELEVKANEPVNLHFEFPVRKVTIEY